MKKVISIVGARPNFIKVAPIHKAFQKYDKTVQHLICHTGQHFDEKMSKIFFEELEMPKPHFYLGVGGGSHAEQTAKIMIEFEKVVLSEKPDFIIVVGDVNSTMACSLVATKLGVPVAHVEAGLRSFDREMPEEINRMVTDVISNYLFVSERSGLENLKREGIDDSKIYFTGNVMIDSLIYYLPKIDKSTILKDMGLVKDSYILGTFHRPSNVDSEVSLNQLVDMLNNLSATKKIVFPVHPRTMNNLIKFGIRDKISQNIIMTEPLGYIEFLALTQGASLLITDSGGIQEETTYLGVQCITVRDNTERPVTVTVGTNQLIGTNLKNVEKAAFNVLSGNLKKGSIPELWDGKVAERITKIIVEKLT
ncbi:MAG: UDP-N-acetylglucosamine 2-epimerase (non-hydrolyzing) [Bacteroidota bacterium]|nr:UDP-N-acetylglucosamine 2-epimerase (non-hydrolyzing) [Bacteroidota bacterium]